MNVLAIRRNTLVVSISCKVGPIIGLWWVPASFQHPMNQLLASHPKNKDCTSSVFQEVTSQLEVEPHALMESKFWGVHLLLKEDKQRPILSRGKLSFGASHQQFLALSIHNRERSKRGITLCQYNSKKIPAAGEFNCLICIIEQQIEVCLAITWCCIPDFLPRWNVGMREAASSLMT
ncbi:uncharacterized protein LOC120108938 [Phoenix dactylifera]|uniref:Uncharacterized protein LOC120108938 n=1 Tax=Phoenix dactylifera TaxID=42345 RepID=A0A8B8ZYY4_PHODC|nr:uncharacterized protein LOC120108938 [Phoenix dactylifera]